MTTPLPEPSGRNSSGKPSLRQLTSEIRHLDASQARRLVELFARPVISDGQGLAYDGSDPVTAGSHGWLSLAPTASHSPAASCVGHYSTHLNLHELLRLPLSVARELALHKGHLYLDKLVRITDSVADELGHHTGGGLSLNNLRQLSTAAAHALGRHGGQLSLDRIRTLVPAVAAGLARHAFELSLGGIAKLSPEAAAALSRHRGDLFLNALVKLPKRVADHLTRHQGNLHLHGVSRLSDAAAEAFGKRTGYLCLQGVERLSPAQAQLLAGHRGALLFNRLEVDEAVAAGLSRHQGALVVPVGRGISLPTLALLVQHGGQLVLDGLEAITEREAEVLASQPHRRGIEGLSGLFVDRIRHITPPVAAILATHRAGDLSLQGITQITEDAALELVKHPILCLDGITSVTDRVAGILATHSGAVLSLKGLENVSSVGLAKLRENPGIELPRRFYETAPRTVIAPMSPAARPGKEELFRAIKQIVAQGEAALRKS